MAFGEVGIELEFKGEGDEERRSSIVQPGIPD